MNTISLFCKRPVNKEILEEFDGLQIIDSTLLYGTEHIEFAHKIAVNAFGRDENISSDLFVETIVRASGQRQIKKAMKMYGLKDSNSIVVFGEKIPTDLLIRIDGKEFEIKMDAQKIKMLKSAFFLSQNELYGAANSELDVIADLIKERVALAHLI